MNIYDLYNRHIYHDMYIMNIISSTTLFVDRGYQAMDLCHELNACIQNIAYATTFVYYMKCRRWIFFWQKLFNISESLIWFIYDLGWMHAVLMLVQTLMSCFCEKISLDVMIILIWAIFQLSYFIWKLLYPLPNSRDSLGQYYAIIFLCSLHVTCSSWLLVKFRQDIIRSCRSRFL